MPRHRSIRLRHLLALPLAAIVSAHAASAAGTVRHLDPSFGDDGFTTFADSDGAALARQTDGKLVVGGTSAGDFVVHRFDASGVTDASFGVAGATRIDITPGSNDVLWAIAIQGDGKILAVGESLQIGWPTLTVVRLIASGALDPTFGTGGIVMSVRMKAYDVALQPDGKIVLVGYNQVALPSGGARDAMGLARLLPDGSPDPTFGDNGAVEILAEDARQLWGVALQSDGKIVVSGESQSEDTFREMLVARFESDGTPDVTFGDGGSVITHVSDDADTGYDVIATPDGKVLVTGVWYPPVGNQGFLLARYLGDGSLDPSFGDGGFAVRAHMTKRLANNQSLMSGGGYGRAIALMSDGRIVQAGDVAIARYLPNGDRDETFGGGAIGTFTATGAVPSFRGVLVQPDGKIVAVGQPQLSSGTGAMLARFAPCDCAPCEACDASGACVAAPRPDCSWGAVTSLTLRDDTLASRDSVKWTWAHGQVDPRGLGWPLDTTDFALCVYDESFGDATVVFAASLPASSACGTDPCWRSPGGSALARYTDSDALVGGIGRVKVKTGIEATNSVSARGRGSALDLSGLPFGNATRVQLQAETGECWESFYEPQDVLFNQDGRFRAAD